MKDERQKSCENIWLKKNTCYHIKYCRPTLQKLAQIHFYFQNIPGAVIMQIGQNSEDELL